MAWLPFLYHWPFVTSIHRPPLDSYHDDAVRWRFIFISIYTLFNNTIQRWVILEATKFTWRRCYAKDLGFGELFKSKYRVFGKRNCKVL